MAGLQHGLPVVGTAGTNTDRALSDAGGLRLLECDRPDLFARETLELALDPAARREMSRAARRLYEGSFDWPVVAAQLSAEIAGACDGARTTPRAR